MFISHAIGYTENLPLAHPRAFEQRDVSVPALQPHDLLVEVAAVSVNPVDVKLRQGAPTEGFRILGFDAAGRVVKVGSAVENFRVGDEVFYAGAIDRPGTNQSLHVVDERVVGRRPRNVSMAESASFPLVALTAWESLFDHFRLTSTSTGTILIIGATGGVGSMMVQILRAVAPGVQIIATASDAERARWISALGAHHVVNHREDWVAKVQHIAPEGVDWLFSAYSENQLEAYAAVVKPFGSIVAIDDGPRDVAPLKGKAISWHWEFMFARSAQQTPDMVRQHEILDEVAQLIDARRIRPTITTILKPFTVETLCKAHELVESGRVCGKVVVEF